MAKWTKTEEETLVKDFKSLSEEDLVKKYNRKFPSITSKYYALTKPVKAKKKKVVKKKNSEPKHSDETNANSIADAVGNFVENDPNSEDYKNPKESPAQDAKPEEASGPDRTQGLRGLKKIRDGLGDIFICAMRRLHSLKK